MSNQYVFAKEMLWGEIAPKDTAVPSGDPLNAMLLTYCPDTVRNIVGIPTETGKLAAVVHFVLCHT